MDSKFVARRSSSAILLPLDLADPAPSAVDRQIADFVDGRSDGAELMLALYGDIANEPLPPRLTELIRAWRSH